MLVFLVLAGIAVYLLYQAIKLERPHNFPPGPPNYPFVGAGLYLKSLNAKTGAETFGKLGEIFGPVTGLYLGNIRALVVNGYEAAKEMWGNDHFAARPELFQIKYVFSGQVRGIFNTNGDLWKEQRRFTIRNLRDIGFGKSSMEGLVHEEIQETMTRLQSSVQEGSSTVHMNGRFTISTTNIIWGIINGKRYSHDDLKLHKLLEALREVLRAGDVKVNLINNYPLTRFIPFLSKDFKIMADGAAEILSTIKEAVNSHKTTRDENVSRDFIDTYLNKMDGEKSENSTFSDDQLAGICFDLFGAGSESTASQIDFAVLYMLLYPEIQEKVHAEIDSVIGKDTYASMSDIPRLPYCEAVLTEILRICPIAPVSVPHASIKNTKFMGYDIPKDTLCSINILSVHMDKSFWGDPETFRPERFLDQNGNFQKPERVVAFGSGKRVCMGETLARMMYYLIFVSFMQKFKIEQVPGESRPSREVRDGFTVTPRPFNGKLTLRN